MSKKQKIVKRGIDLVVSIFALFDLYKLRSMITRDHSGSTVTVKNDSSITAHGAFLRKFKIDELPQLINVLKGDMSLVGPRPDVPGYMDKLEGESKLLLELRPGITGPASIKYRDEEAILEKVRDPIIYNDSVIFPDKVSINLDYYNNYSLKMDMVYILATLRLVQVPELQT